MTFKAIARQLANAVPGLKSGPVRSILKGAYYRSRDPLGRGATVHLAGVAMRIPRPLLYHWEEAGVELYERETMQVAADWLRSHAPALVLDLGAHIGVFTLLALWADPRNRVIALDSDPNGLKATRNFCTPAGLDRLRFVHGYVSDRGERSGPLPEVVARTEATLQDGRYSDDPARAEYICLEQGPPADIPSHRLDDLLRDEDLSGRSILLKCDIEGAELLALRGGEAFLRRHRPTMLLSVHPKLVIPFGYTADDVRAFVEGLGYTIKVLAVDHEEHWWCEPTGR